VSASYDGSVKLWNTSNGVCNFTLVSYNRYELIDILNSSPFPPFLKLRKYLLEISEREYVKANLALNESLCY